MCVYIQHEYIYIYTYTHTLVYPLRVIPVILKEQTLFHTKKHLPTWTCRHTGKLSLSVWKCQAPCWC